MFAVTPDFEDYSGRGRLVRAAWNLLVNRELADLSLTDLADAAGVVRSTFHREYGTRHALFALVADAALALIHVNLSETLSLEDLVTAWIRLAHARPRHYNLTFSIDYSSHAMCSKRRAALIEKISSEIQDRIKRRPTDEEALTVLAMIHGVAAIAASGQPRPPSEPLVRAIDAFLQLPALPAQSSVPPGSTPASGTIDPALKALIMARLGLGGGAPGTTGTNGFGGCGEGNTS
jgi:AcrR family transcriptional regulator